MSRALLCRSMVALTLTLGACDAPASVPTAAREPAATPAGVAPTATPAIVPAPAPAPAGSVDGAVRTVRLSDGTSVALTPWKLDAKSGLSDASCGVTIGGQRIATIGSGDSDTYTCGALIDAGALPPAGATPRIGLIYRVSSPNAAFSTAIVLLGGAGGWQVDPDSIGTYDDSPAAKSIAALATALR
ncbi:hypothetical protein [Sphingomonas sp. PB4P5]|uniref:hypothetical protein n=1 Tax=Parasphingomonas puruogangriensis TaxID=3096155 RepID=UPI002FC70E56